MNEENNAPAEPTDKKKDFTEVYKEKVDEGKAVKAASNALAQENNQATDNTIADQQADNILAALSYFSFLCILPLILRPKSSLCQLHGRQGLVLVILWIILSPLRHLGSFVMGSGFHSFFGLLFVIVSVYGIYLAATGKEQEIPGIGKAARFLRF